MQCMLRGKVMYGDGLGHLLGFPTANIDRRHWARFLRKPKLGIYAGYVLYGKKLYKAAIIVGPRDGKGLPKLEAHLLGFKGSLYGKKLEFSLVKFLRPFRPYKNAESLVSQIKKDIQNVKRNLS